MTNPSDDQHTTAGWARALLLVGLAGVLVVSGVLLWLVLGAGTGDEEEGEEEVVEPAPPRRPAGPQVAVRRAEPQPEEGPKRSMLKTTQRVQNLMDHLRKPGKAADELASRASRVKVTVKGPPNPPEGMHPDIWVHMNEVLPGVTRCYQRRLLEKPGLQGKLVLSLSMVAATGHAKARGDVHKDSTIKDYKLQQCVLKRLSTAGFPMPLAEMKLKATYPIVLRPGAVQASAAPGPPSGGTPQPPVKGTPRGTPSPAKVVAPRGQPHHEPPPPDPASKGEPKDPRERLAEEPGDHKPE